MGPRLFKLSVVICSRQTPVSDTESIDGEVSTVDSLRGKWNLVQCLNELKKRPETAIMIIKPVCGILIKTLSR